MIRYIHYIIKFLLFLCLTYNQGYSQRLILTIDAIESNTAKFQNTATFIKQSLEKNFIKHKGIIIVDRDQTQAILKERELQKHESFIDGVTVKQDKALGAQLILKLSFSSETTELQLKVVDVETGGLELIKNISIKDFISSSNFKIKREDYFDRFLKDLINQLLVELKIQSEIKLIKIENRNGSDMGLLHCPEGCNLRTDDELLVFTTKELSTEVGEKIGLIRIKGSESENLFIAEIKEGKKEIINQINKNLRCYVVL